MKYIAFEDSTCGPCAVAVAPALYIQTVSFRVVLLHTGLSLSSLNIYADPPILAPNHQEYMSQGIGQTAGRNVVRCTQRIYTLVFSFHDVNQMTRNCITFSRKFYADLPRGYPIGGKILILR